MFFCFYYCKRFQFIILEEISLEGKEKRIETKCIHSGYDSQVYNGSLIPPLFQTATFTFSSAEEGARRFASEEAGYVYSRLGNPTVEILEKRMAELEGAEVALAFGSGMAAVSSVLMTLTKAGDHILCSQGVYGCTYGLLHLLEEKYQISHQFSTMSSREELMSCITPETTCIYIETPINPTLDIVDLEMVAAIGKEKQIPVVVDNTFCSPYLQNPISFGCDIVIHSATKYLCGHGDVIAGIVAGKKVWMDDIARQTRKDIGGIISPFDAWLLLRGIKTLAIRLDRHSQQAAILAEFLRNHEKIEQVYYPGFADHPQAKIIAKQMKQPGGLISFKIKGGQKEAQALMNHLSLIKVAVSLGDAETLIQHPATMTHAVVPKEEREKMGIEDNLLRLSVGLEAFEDIKADLSEALYQLK